MPTAPTVSRAPAPPVDHSDPLANLTKHKRFGCQVAGILSRNPGTADAGVRMRYCADRVRLLLELRSEVHAKAHLVDARLCKLRACPFCEWRRVRAWRARLLQACENVRKLDSTLKPVMLTLTVRNCPVDELSDTLDFMNAGWRKLSRRAVFPSDLWFRRTEVTLGRPVSPSDGAPAPFTPGGGDGHLQGASEALSTRSADGTALGPVGEQWAHPHFHVLMWVRSSYWGRNYIRQGQWVSEWADALGVDYAPSVDVRKAYSGCPNRDPSELDGGAACEVAKYITKATDMLKLGDRLPDFLDQLRSKRMVAVSQRLRPFMLAEDIEQWEMFDALPVGADQHNSTHAIAQWVKETDSYQIVPPAEGGRCPSEASPEG